MKPADLKNGEFQAGKNWWIFLILGILAIGVGIWMLCYKAAAFVVISYVFAAYFIIAGLCNFIYILSNRESINSYGWPMAGSILVFLFGCLLVCTPFLKGAIVLILFAIGVMILGISCIANCVNVEGTFSKILVVILGVLVFIGGFLLLYNPFAGVLSVAFIEALVMLIAGINGLYLSYKLCKVNSARKKIEKAMK